MTTIDFISIRSQQNFEDKAKINPIEIKIEKAYFFQAQLKITPKKYSLP